MARAKKEAHKGWCGVVWCGVVGGGVVGCVPDVLTTLWCLLWSICIYNSAYHIMCQLIYCLTMPPLLPEQPTGIWLSSLPWGGGEELWTLPGRGWDIWTGIWTQCWSSGAGIGMNQSSKVQMLGRLPGEETLRLYIDWCMLCRLTVLILPWLFTRLKFIESGRECFINSDMFYVEVCLKGMSVL